MQLSFNLFYCLKIKLQFYFEHLVMMLTLTCKSTKNAKSTRLPQTRQKVNQKVKLLCTPKFTNKNWLDWHWVLIRILPNFRRTNVDYIITQKIPETT